MHGRVLTGLALATTIASLITGNTPLVRLSYVLWAVLVVAGVLTWTSVRWLVVSRHTRARRAQVGGLAEETLTVTNASILPKLWLEIDDHSDLPDHRAGRVLSSLGPGASRSWTVRTRCRRRGAFALGPITLAAGDPLGLFRLERQLEQTRSLVVFPRTVPVGNVDLPSGYLPGGQVVRRRAQFATSNIRSVRQYQPGDAYSRIHWPTTARRGRLYSKEYELDPFADFWLLVDLDRQVHVGEIPAADESWVLPWLGEEEGELDPTTEEYAITAAASLARRFIDMGRSVGLVAHGQRRVVLQPDRGERQLTKLLTNLAVLRAVGRAGLSEVLSVEGDEFTRHTTLVVVTPTSSRRWVEALRELQYRGVAAMVVLIEANSFGPAGASDAAIGLLASHAIPTRRVRRGDDLAAALSA